MGSNSNTDNNVNYRNMEKELINTVLEEETIHGIANEPTFYGRQAGGMGEDDDDEEEETEIRKQPVKLGLALLTGAAALAGIVLFANSFSTDYVYSKAEAEYQNCLMLMAKEDYAGALQSVELLLQEDKGSLEYLALKNTVCEKSGDAKGQIKVLRKIIAADADNYQAYEKLLERYLEDGNQDGIVGLAADAPNSVIASMLKEYLVDVPYLGLTPGVYDSSQELVISSEAGNSIYYTLDGSSPQERGTLYTMPIPLEQDRFYSVRAVCKNERDSYGEEATGEYQIGINAQRIVTAESISQPTVYPDSGIYTSPQTVSLEFPIGYQAYYSWSLGDMLTPQNGTLYTGGIPMPEGNSVLSVIVTDGQGNCSAVKQIQYSYQP